MMRRCRVFASHRELARYLMLACGLFAHLQHATPASACELNDPRAASLNAADAKTREGLMRGMAGDVEGRRTALQAALSVEPDYALARWHLRQLRVHDTWLNVRTFESRQAEEQTLLEYRKRRQAIHGDPQREWALSQWCHKKNLADRARFHLYAILENEASTTEQRQAAIESLGLRAYEGAWRSPEEIHQLEHAAEKQRQDLDKWVPVLQRLSNALTGNGAKRKRAARDKLTRLTDVASISALEQVFSSKSEALALEAVEVIGRMPEY